MTVLKVPEKIRSTRAIWYVPSRSLGQESVYPWWVSVLRNTNTPNMCKLRYMHYVAFQFHSSLSTCTAHHHHSNSNYQ